MPLLSLDLRTEVTSMKSQFGQRFQLIAFFTFGTTFALVHHFIGQHLDGKPAGDDGIRLRGYLIVSDQALVGAGSNALSQIIKYCFAGTIAIAFSQYFWTSIEPFSSHRGGGEVGPYQAIVRVRQDQLVSIDAPLAAGKGNPFLPSSIRVWLYAPRLAFISLLMLTMLSIPIVVPGSIHVISSEFGVLEPCSIPSPVIDQVHVSGIYEGSVTRRSITRRQVQEDRHNVNGTHEHTHTPTVRTKAIVNSVLITGSYLPVTSPCGRCSYNATFTGPSFRCDRIFDSALFYSLQLAKNGTMSLYIGVFDHSTDDIITVALQDGMFLAPNPPTGVKCRAFSARYTVRVSHDVSSTIDVLRIVIGDKIDINMDDPAGIQLSGMVEAVGLALQGNILYWNGTEDLKPTMNVAYSPLLKWSRVGDNQSKFEWADMEVALPALMQNVSLSLLSGQFMSRSGDSYFSENEGTCARTRLIYIYSRGRLLGIYGAGWAVTGASLVLGFVLVRRNGRERDLAFSNLVDGLGGMYTQW